MLGTYLRNRILNLQGRSATPGDVQGFLEQAIVEGSPELASAATAFLEDHPGDRVGSTTGKGVLGPLRWVEGVGSGTFTWSSHSWDVRDFGDQLPDFLPELLSADGPRPATEPRQCLFLHAAAGLLLHRRGDIPDLGSVRREAALLQRDMHRQATACADALGPEPAEQTQAEVDLRVFLHDAVYFGHDKDYRCLAALPPEAASQVTLCMVRLDQWGRVTYEAIQGISSASGPEEVVWLLVHQGHMRLLCPAGPVPLPSPVRYVAAAGWEAHLEAAVASGALSKPKTVPACPRCTSDSQRRTGLPVGVFGLYPPPDHGPVASASQCRAGLASWEAAEPDQASWTRADLAAFFAPQPLPDGPLDFLEVYAGEARASAAVRARGGTALSVGLDHGHDLNQGVARSKVRAALRLLAPRHLWLSWPCTAFCGWSHLNALRSPDHAASLRLGRHHLRFSTSLAAAQLAAARHVSAENPLTSSAWREPCAVQAFQALGRVRLDQCTTGLAGPQGGLHLKPTLIKSSCSDLLAALDRRCPGSHSHELVQGTATAASAMYSGPLASLIARAVLPEARSAPGPPISRRTGGLREPPLVLVGGGRACFASARPLRAKRSTRARRGPGDRGSGKGVRRLLEE